MGLGPSPPRPSWPSWAMPAGLSAATRWCATRGWTSPSMPLTASAAPGTYRARAPRCCAGRCLRRPRPPPVPARPTMPTTSRSRAARAATGPPWRWPASSPAECAIPSRAWATPPSPRSRTWLWRRRPDHGWCVPAQASRCAAASARRPPAATAGPWTASKDRAAAHSGDTPSIILSPDPAGSVHPDKAGRPHAHAAHHHRGQGGERPGLIIVDLPSPASMRRSSPAPRSFVLALLRALHPWPRLRFGAATPPPGKVHSTNQINRSPLTGGLSTDKEGSTLAANNRGVVYTGPGQVEVQDLDYPKLELHEQNHRQLQHGVILKIVATNICGSDQHMVRGRTTAPEGQTLGHEITGEVAEVGRDVEFIKVGDLVSVPFNIACGRCRNCKERNTGVCENVNPARAGAAYGYVDMGGWLGGQANYVTVPYADFNLLKFPDKDQAMAKIRDLAMLSDIFPTGYHGAVSAGVTTGSTVYVAGAGPVGLACATSAHLLGAAVVIVGDMNKERLAQAASFGCETIDLSETDDLRGALGQILGGSGEVDAAVDCVGFEARGHGAEGSQGEAPATVLNTVMDITRAAGKLGIPGLYVTGDPGAVDEPAKVGSLSIRIGLGWAKSHAFQTGQCPVMKYNRQLMMAILHDKVQIAKNVNATVIPLEQAPQGYADFDKGAARKYVLDPHGMVA